MQETVFQTCFSIQEKSFDVPTGRDLVGCGTKKHQSDFAVSSAERGLFNGSSTCHLFIEPFYRQLTSVKLSVRGLRKKLKTV